MTYELIKEFTYTNAEKQIMTIAKGTKLEFKDNGFLIKVKTKIYKLDKDIVEKNPDYFQKMDTLVELTEMIRKNRKTTAPKLAKMIDAFYQLHWQKDYHPLLNT